MKDNTNKKSKDTAVIVLSCEKIHKNFTSIKSKPKSKAASSNERSKRAGKNRAKDKIKVLSNLDLRLHSKEKVAIMGPSGIGKTTLLNLLGGLDKPDAGRVFWEKDDITKLSEEDLASKRNGKIGFVYQFHHLLMEFSALENVSIPLIIGGLEAIEAEQRAKDILSLAGLGRRLTHNPGELSGGERQRVAVARALVVNPIVLLMDEPTGNLDTKTAKEIHELILDLSNQFGTAIIEVTHNNDLCRLMDKTYVLKDGKLARS